MSGEVRIDLNISIRRYECSLITVALRMSHGDVEQAAEILCIDQCQLNEKLQAHNINASQFKGDA